MRTAAKPKPNAVYGALLHAYPHTFRKHYGATMEQTFDDMLGDQPSMAGRLAVWARTLLDLPFSALKEHVTNGKDVLMNRTTKLVIICATVAILIVGAGSYWLGGLHAMKTAGIERVGVATMADAMQQDHFYSDYGNSTLLFTAKVRSVQQDGGATLVTFETGRPYSVTCQFPHAVTAKSGQTLALAVPGGSAVRQPHGVLLHNCVLN